MADTMNPDWMNQWQALARQYASNWQNLPTGGAAASPAAAPAAGFEQWSQLFAPGAGSQGETIERLVDSTKNYLAGMQAMFAAASANAQGGNAPWSNAFAQGFVSPSMASPVFDHPAARAWRQMAAHGGDGFAPVAGALQPPAPADMGELKAWLTLPTFGSSREQQEHYQRTAVAAVEYQEQMNRYNALMLRASQRGFELFEGKLAEREQPGRQIESLRALYDLWVDGAEEGYAEVALSIEFREVYAALVNAQMRMRALLQQAVERNCNELGMPTRSEVNSIGERLQALRREVRAGSADSLSEEIAELRQQLAALNGNAQPTRSTKKSAGRASVNTARKRVTTAKRATSSRAAPSKTRAVVATQGPRTRAGKKTAAASKTVRASQARLALKSSPSEKRAGATKATPAKAARVAGTKKSARRATKKPGKPATTASASGARNFASRIAKFANASLGTSKARSRKTQKPSKPKSAKTR